MLVRYIYIPVKPMGNRPRPPELIANYSLLTGEVVYAHIPLQPFVYRSAPAVILFWPLTSDYYSVHSRVWILIWWKWRRLLPPNASFLYTNRVLHPHIINKMVQVPSYTLTASQRSLSRFCLPLLFPRKVPSSFRSLIHSKNPKSTIAQMHN